VSDAEHGFVLTPTYRLVAGRPQVHLYAVLENGEPALIVDGRVRPYCFVRAADVERVRPIAPAATIADTDLTTFADESVVRVEVATPADLPPLRGRLGDAGISTFEADVRFAYRYLIDHGIRGGFRVRGPFERREGVGRVYRDPELEPSRWTPNLRVLSFDIETSLDGDTLYAIAAAGTGRRPRVDGRRRARRGREVVPDARTLLQRFLVHVRAADPDVLTGWSVVEFDLQTLQRHARRAGIRLTLGRNDEDVDIQRDASFTREPRAMLGGRVVLDGLALVRSSYIRLEDYRLETAARALVGRGKLITGPEAGGEIEAAYREEPARLAAYNLNDARLVLDILERTKLVELAVQRSLMTGMQLDRVSAQIAAVDSLYLGELRPRGRVAPSVDVAGAETEGITGGLVLDSTPGLYDHILVFDFASLYPSLIRTFNLDPLTLVATPGPDAIRTPSGAAFARTEGILPALVARLSQERAAAKRAGDAVASQATKILMNSLFGVLGSPASRLFSPTVANAITIAGQHVIRLAADGVERRGHRVIYGDTDSLFVDVGARDDAAARAAGERLRAEIEHDVAAAIERDFGCTSHLVLAFQKVYARFFMPETRGAGTGSKKRYAGLVGAELDIVGLEAVRRDWSPVARRFQRELLMLVLNDQPVAAFVQTFVRELRQGRFDDELAYRKAVRKPLADYTRTTPPHVKAARKQGGAGQRLVRYVITKAGPEPVGATTAPPDYEHYVTQQLRPIADAILRFLDGPDFDDLIGARKQLSLFPERRGA
jgi:DNA polymerase-2